MVQSLKDSATLGQAEGLRLKKTQAHHELPHSLCGSSCAAPTRPKYLKNAFLGALMRLPSF